MQSNEKPIVMNVIKIGAPDSTSKWHSKRNKSDANEKTDHTHNAKLEIFDITGKSSPVKVKSDTKNDKIDKKTNFVNKNNTKGPFRSQTHNQITTRLKLNASAANSISNLRPSRVFASQSNAQCYDLCHNEKLTDGVPQQHNCQLHHSFISDITDVRQMENTLLQLLDDFHSGKLQAFGQDITFEKMESVREQQEKLARLHFDLNLQQEVYGHQTEEGRRIAKDNMSKLIENLQHLSNSIEQLQSRSSTNSSS